MNLQNLYSELTPVKGERNMYSGVMTFTPEQINILIEKNNEYRKLTGLPQRNVAQSAVRNYVKDMQLGRWNLNGEPLIIINHYIANGQHRMHSALKANTPLRSFVVVFRDLPTSEAIEKFSTMDNNVPRQPGQIFELAGAASRSEGALFAAVTKIIQDFFEVESGQLRRFVGDSNNSRIGRVEYFNTHPGIADSARHCRALEFRPQRIVGALHYIIGQLYGQAIRNTFFDRLVTGANLQENQPVNRLREALLRGVEAGTSHDYTANVVAAMFIKAFNLEYTGQSAKGTTIRFRPNQDSYPQFTDATVAPDPTWFSEAANS